MRTLLPDTLVWLPTAVVVCSFALEAIAVLLLVDLASGLFHWLEDTFWTGKTPIVGRWVVTPNILHHRAPGAFVDKSWLESSWDLVAFGACIVAVSWGLHCLTWQVWLFAVVGANANQIHKWTHVPQHRLPWAVRELQKMGVLQSAADHAPHHRGEKNTAYCVITPWVNPVLDRLGVWRGLERLVVRRGAAPRRADLAGALLLAVLVLGLGSGCASPATGDPGPGVLRAVSGTDAAGWYVRSAAAALPVTRGVPCSTWNLDSAAGEDAPRRAHAMDDSNERTVAVRSTLAERR